MFVQRLSGRVEHERRCDNPVVTGGPVIVLDKIIVYAHLLKTPFALPGVVIELFRDENMVKRFMVALEDMREVDVTKISILLQRRG